MLKPVLGWDEFLNEELNNRINMAVDYRFSSDHDLFTGERHFSFLMYPFILSTANKVEKLLRDNLLAHFSERQRTFVHSLLTGVRDTPFLHLHISREDIVSDTLSQVSHSTMRLAVLHYLLHARLIFSVEKRELLMCVQRGLFWVYKEGY